MGRVITTNSATLVNKGLEVIEAHLLFDIPFDRIDVVVHPQQLIHSMVEFVDGAVVAQLGLPTMLVPISLGHGLARPGARRRDADRLDAGRGLALRARSTTRSSPPSGWPGPAGERGGTAPAVYNAANEVCVEAFHAGRLALHRHRLHGGPRPGHHDVPSKEHLAVDDVLAADAWARERGRPHRRVPTHPTPHREAPMTALLLHARRRHLRRWRSSSRSGCTSSGTWSRRRSSACKVPQWFIGFGPTVWSRQIGETEYGVKAIPLGGYVKIVGMLPAGRRTSSRRRGTTRTARRSTRCAGPTPGMFTQLISDARAAEWEHVKAHDTDRLFYKPPVVEEGDRDGRRPDGQHRHRVRPVLVLFATYGNPRDEVVEPVVADVRRRASCPSPSRAAPAPPTTRATPGRREAGLEAGDGIVSFNGTPFTDWDSVQAQIRDNADGDAVIVVDAATSS